MCNNRWGALFVHAVRRQLSQAITPLPNGHKTAAWWPFTRSSLHVKRFGSNGIAALAGLPDFVQDEFDAFLECGILAYGFLRLRCADCGHEKLVAFSCKRRGFCPSCGGRRMAQTAAHLADCVIPRVPVRQWERLTSSLLGRFEFLETLPRDRLIYFLSYFRNSNISNS